MYFSLRISLMTWHVLTKQQQQQKSIRQCLVGLEIVAVAVVCSVCAFSSGSLQVLVSGALPGDAAEWEAGGGMQSDLWVLWGSGNQNFQKTP